LTLVTAVDRLVKFLDCLQWSPLSGPERHICRTGRQKCAATLSGEASSMASDATVIRQWQQKNLSAMESRAVTAPPSRANGGNFRLLSSCHRSSHCSVHRHWSRDRARPSCCSARRRLSRRHVGSALHDHAASSALHDRATSVKGSTPRRLGRRRSPPRSSSLTAVLPCLGCLPCCRSS
jgi:hypothetical protein